jgi:hypothetical protein
MDAPRLEMDSSSMSSKLALARLSEDLMTDPKAREDFIQDPIAWVRTTYKVDPSPSDQEFLNGYMELMAGGSCCGHGCGCGGGGGGGQGSGCAQLRSERHRGLGRPTTLRTTPSRPTAR